MGKAGFQTGRVLFRGLLFEEQSGVRVLLRCEEGADRADAAALVGSLTRPACDNGRFLNLAATQPWLKSFARRPLAYRRAM